ncbi:hypothetical protein AMTRI_Chr04g249030 [Amborella trichopoda]
MWRCCLKLRRPILGFGLNGSGYCKRWFSSNSLRFAALWGNGDYGRLGLSSLMSQWVPTVCKALERENPCAIACGGAHTLFLTDTGRVFATGLNDFGQLGISAAVSHALEPLEVVSIPEKAVQVSAGSHHSAAITVDGAVYMWGNNSSGQLGLGKKAMNIISTPTRVERLIGFNIRKISLGSEHSVAITDDGHVLSWGAGGSGRLGHRHQPSMLGFFGNMSEYTPRLIKTFEGTKIKRIAAGLLHSACIDENGTVYTFGEEASDKLGFGDKKNSTSPSRINEIPCSQDLACGGYHTCVVTSGGEVYTWGTNENGCLGLGNPNPVYSPTRVEGPLLGLPTSEVSCGWKHTAAISGGNIFTWGWGGSHGTFSEDGHSSGGQLGHGNDFDYFEPTRVDFMKNAKALHVSCGFNHTGAIFEYA